jgi:alpha-L-fucosidase
VDNLVGLYFPSVGRNAKLLLNVPPMREGLLHPTDVARLTAFRAALGSVFGFPRGSFVSRKGSAAMELDLGKPTAIRLARLEERIAGGQNVARYTLSGAADGTWQELSRGTTIGYTKLDRFTPVTVQRVRLAIEESVGAHEGVTVKLYA